MSFKNSSFIVNLNKSTVANERHLDSQQNIDITVFRATANDVIEFCVSLFCEFYLLSVSIIMDLCLYFVIIVVCMYAK